VLQIHKICAVVPVIGIPKPALWQTTVCHKAGFGIPITFLYVVCQVIGSRGQATISPSNMFGIEGSIQVVAVLTSSEVHYTALSYTALSLTLTAQR